MYFVHININLILKSQYVTVMQSTRNSCPLIDFITPLSRVVEREHTERFVQLTLLLKHVCTKKKSAIMLLRFVRCVALFIGLHYSWKPAEMCLCFSEIRNSKRAEEFHYFRKSKLKKANSFFFNHHLVRSKGCVKDAAFV